jgi:hypothetical protein
MLGGVVDVGGLGVDDVARAEARMELRIRSLGYSAS